MAKRDQVRPINDLMFLLSRTFKEREKKKLSDQISTKLARLDNVNTPSQWDQRTVLQAACEYGNLDVAKLVVSLGADINKSTRSCASPLVTAAGYGKKDVFRFLLKKGVETNEKSGTASALHQVCRVGREVYFAKKLIEHGADINACDERGQTPVALAVSQAHLALVRVLIDAGADVDTTGDDHESPLQNAASSCDAWPKYRKILQLLVEKGADVNRIDRYGRTPLDIVTRPSMRHFLESHGAKTAEAIRGPTVEMKPKYRLLYASALSKSAERQIQSVLAKQRVKISSESLRKIVLSSICITPKKVKEKSIALGRSKLGGSPDLPKGCSWPRIKKDGAHLPFVLQIDLAECSKLDRSGLLPNRGLLSLFYDQEAEKQAVLFSTDLRSLERQTVAEEEISFEESFNSCRLQFREAYTIPGFGSVWMDEQTLCGDDSDKRDRIRRQLRKVFFGDRTKAHKMLGYPDPIQNDPLEGVYSSMMGSPGKRPAKQLSDPQKWLMLMQVDTDPVMGTCWGDCGALYLYIPKKDLEKSNFAAARAQYQSC